jgi:hypothetical protein
MRNKDRTPSDRVTYKFSLFLLLVLLCTRGISSQCFVLCDSYAYLNPYSQTTADCIGRTATRKSGVLYIYRHIFVPQLWNVCAYGRCEGEKKEESWKESRQILNNALQILYMCVALYIFDSLFDAGLWLDFLSHRLFVSLFRLFFPLFLSATSLEWMPFIRLSHTPNILPDCTGGRRRGALIFHSRSPLIAAGIIIRSSSGGGFF